MPFVVRVLGGIGLLLVVVAARGPLNAVLRPLVDAVLYPFRGLHPLIGLTAISIPVSIGALLLFRVTSDQERLGPIKDRIFAGLFEIRLFNDDLGAIFRAQREILVQNLKYFGLGLVPLLWMIGPFVLLLGQLQFHYGYHGLDPGESTLLVAELRDDAVSGPQRPDAALEVPEGVTVETPAVWLPGRDSLVWRISAEKPGEHELRIRVGADTFTKTLRVGDEIARRSPLRVAASMGDLLYPAEAPLPGSGPVQAISLGYRAGASFAGLSGWVWAFFGLTLVIGFALKDRFGVTI